MGRTRFTALLLAMLLLLGMAEGWVMKVLHHKRSKIL